MITTKIKSIHKTELIGYCRVSTKKQTGNYSLEFQSDQIKEFAEKHGYKIIKIFTEQINGNALNRPEFGKALDMLKLYPSARLITIKADRLSRNTADIFKLLDNELKDRVMFCNTGNILPNSLIMGMLFVFADYERKLINDRIRAGIIKAKEAGKFRTNLPQQNARFLKKIRGEAIISNNALKLARLIEIKPKLIPLKSLSHREQADYLNAIGFTTIRGQKWNVASIGWIWREFKKLET